MSGGGLWSFQGTGPRTGLALLCGLCTLAHAPCAPSPRAIVRTLADVQGAIAAALVEGYEEWSSSATTERSVSPSGSCNVA